MAVSLATTIVATWSLVLHPATTLPLGTEHQAIVPVFSLWNLWWVGDRAFHGFQDFWNAPIFHPEKGTLGFSEPLILPGLLVAPLWRAGTPPALIYNTALLTLLVLNGVLGYRLARAFEAPVGLAGSCACMSISLPFVTKHLGVMSIIPVFGLWWTLDGFVRFGRQGRLRDSLWAAGGYLCLFLASQQLALLFAPFALAAGFVAFAKRRRAQAVVPLGACALVALIPIVGVARAGILSRAAQGFERSEGIVQVLSAKPFDFLLRPPTALFPVPPRALPVHGDTAGLFPGALLLVMAATGFVAGWRSREWRAWALYLAGSVAGACLLALGLNLQLGQWRPFETLRASLPGFNQLRAPYRYAGIVQASLVPLAALNFTRKGAFRSASRGRAGSWLVALGLLAGLENLNIPAPLQAIPPKANSVWTVWLREHRPETIIAHVPFPGGLHVSDYEIEARRLFAQLAHGQRMVNGFSSFFPPAYTRLQLEMAPEFPSPRLLCVLHRIFGAELLVVDLSWLEKHTAQMEAPEISSALDLLFEDGEVRIYRLRAPAGCIDREFE